MQKIQKPFDRILGSYVPLIPVRLNHYSGKSYLFLGDHWQEIGDIVYITDGSSERGEQVIGMHVPNPQTFASQHEQEGAIDWLKWGPRVN